MTKSEYESEMFRIGHAIDMFGVVAAQYAPGGPMNKDGRPGRSKSAEDARKHIEELKRERAMLRLRWFGEGGA